MTDREAPRTVEQRGRSLAFAVRLVDAFTGDQPRDGVTVETDRSDVTPVRNASGYVCFLDVDADAVTMTIDGGDRYVDERRRVRLDEEADDGTPGGDRASADADPPVSVVSDPSEPVVVELSPTPAYGFPDTTTVVRGHVMDEDEEPVGGARVSLREFDPVVETTASGEYALWVPVNATHVRSREDRSVVVVDGLTDAGRAAADGGPGTDPTLVVSHPTGGETAEQIEVRAGTRTVHYVTLG
jgi:hypothetical protein